MSVANDSASEQLQMLDRLHQEGLISDALYDRRRHRLQVGHTSSNSFSREKTPDNPKDEIAIENGRYIALVLGSNQYRHFESLETAINDARAVGNLLHEKFGFEVQLLENPDRQKLVGTLATLRRSLSPQDSLIIYYAGHGVLDDVTGRGYWLPTDAEKDNPANWISTSEINDALLSLPSQQVLVIADSCYSGSLANNEVRPVSNFSGRNSRTGNSRVQKISRTVITSGGLEPVLDSIDGIHSVFARALLEQLESYQPGSTLTEVYRAIAKRVADESDQSPGYHQLHSAGHQQGEFRFPDLDSIGG